MNNRLLLKQARDAIKKHIEQSPYEVLINRFPLIDNGFGGLCQDPAGVSAEVKILGRISRESRMIQAIKASPSGLDSSATMFLIIPHDQTISEGDQFGQWRAGLVTPLHKFGGIYAFEVALYPA